MSKKGGEGRVIANPKNFIANLCIQKKAQCNFKKGTGGDQGRLANFQKISIFGETDVPYVLVANEIVKSAD